MANKDMRRQKGGGEDKRCSDTSDMKERENKLDEKQNTFFYIHFVLFNHDKQCLHCT